MARSRKKPARPIKHQNRKKDARLIKKNHEVLKRLLK